MNPAMVGIDPPPDYIVTGGARGGTKTHSLLHIAAFRGNPQAVQKKLAAGKEPSQADLMYIGHKNYRGLILRPQATDLTDILDRAEEMYGPTGAIITRGSPPMAEWPRTGAKIIFGHFLDDGWKKYIGAEFQFIGIDQMELMPLEETFHRILGSLRSKWPELRTLAMATFNPGGGDDMKGAPGQGWIMSYFMINAYLDGKVPRFAGIRYPDKNIRMFVPSKVQDNPYFLYTQPRLNETKDGIFCFSCEGEIPVPMAARPLEESNKCPLCAGKLMDDGEYLKRLNAIEPESLRRAWRDGDMRAMSGQYFTDWRPNGPLPGEEAYPAKHVYDPADVRLEPWWHTWASVDWGYIHPASVHFHKKSPWGQIYTFKEISLKRVEPFELGVLIAREARPILEGMGEELARHMTIYLSPDAFAKKESENTIASQMAAGISKELGPRSVFLADLTEDERELRNSTDALQAMQARRTQQKQTLITIVRASNDRVAGWMHMQTLLRFRPLNKESTPDKEFADRLYQEKGLVAFQEYMNSPEFSAVREVLPKWQVSKDCRELINAIPKAMHKPGTSDLAKFDATESASGDDSLDDCFVAGTLVETENGSVPVEKLNAGIKVWTRQGLRPIRVWKKSAPRDVLRVDFKDGSTLTGTPEHPVLEFGGEWKKIGALRQGEQIESWQTSERFIKRFGSQLMARFRRATTFITRTKTPSTTTSQISKPSPHSITYPSMAKSWASIQSIWLGSAPWRPGGIGVRKAWSGTVKTGSATLIHDSLFRQPALAAGLSIPVWLYPGSIRVFAPGPANRSGGDSKSWTGQSGHAGQYAEQPSTPTNTHLNSAKTVQSITSAGRAEVYNLEVQDVHEYFANGVLVHNCRYGLYSEERQGINFPPIDQRVEDRMKELGVNQPGLSDHSLIMARRHAYQMETVGKKKQAMPVLGANRLAVRRAMLGNRQSNQAPKFLQ